MTVVIGPCLFSESKTASTRVIDDTDDNFITIPIKDEETKRVREQETVDGSSPTITIYKTYPANSARSKHDERNDDLDNFSLHDVARKTNGSACHKTFCGVGKTVPITLS